MDMSPVYQVRPKPFARQSERGKKTRQTEEEELANLVERLDKASTT